MSRTPLPKQTRNKRKGKRMWKGRYSEVNLGTWPRWRHGMGGWDGHGVANILIYVGTTG